MPLPAKNFADTTMADPKLPGDVAGPDTLMGKFHYPLADYIWEWPSIHKNPPQADSLLHVLKQIRNKKQGEGWLEPVT